MQQQQQQQQQQDDNDEEVETYRSHYLHKHAEFSTLLAVARREGWQARTWIGLLREVIFLTCFLIFVLLQADLQPRNDMLTLMESSLFTTSFSAGNATTTSSEETTPGMVMMENFTELPVLSFMDISSQEEFWLWVDEVLYTNIFVPVDYPFQLGRGNYILWGVRFRQIRVQQFPGCVGPIFSDYNCMPTFEDRWEETASGFYGAVTDCPKMNNSCNASELVIQDYLYTWQPESVLNDPSYIGFGATYPGSGFAVVLPLNTLSARTRLNQMKSPATPYIDEQTRAIFVTFTVFNTNTNVIAYVQAIAEQTATGTWIPNYIVESAVFWHSDLKSGFTAVFLFLSHVMMLVFAFATLAEISSSSHAHDDFAQIFWILLDLSSVGLNFYAIYYIFYYYIGLGVDFPTSMDSAMISYYEVQSGNNSFTRIQDGTPFFFSGCSVSVEGYLLVQVVYSWIILFSSLRVCRYLSAVAGFEEIYRTLNRATLDILFYLFLIAFMLLAYALCATVVIGQLEFNYETTISSFLVLWSSLLFGQDVRSLYALYPAGESFLSIFFISFSVFFFFFFAPAFIGIIYTAWRIETELIRKERAKHDILRTKKEQRDEGDQSCFRMLARSCCCCCKCGSRNSSSVLSAEVARKEVLKGKDEDVQSLDIVQSISEFFGYPIPGWIPDTFLEPRLLAWYVANAKQRDCSYVSADDVRNALSGARTDSYNGPVDRRQVVFLFMLCGDDALLTEEEYRTMKETGETSQLGAWDPTSGETSGPDESLVRRLSLLVRNIQFEDRMRTMTLESRTRTLALNQAQMVRILEYLRGDNPIEMISEE